MLYAVGPAWQAVRSLCAGFAPVQGAFSSDVVVAVTEGEHHTVFPSRSHIYPEMTESWTSARDAARPTLLSYQANNLGRCMP
jgi:hypothetical protein